MTGKKVNQPTVLAFMQVQIQLLQNSNRFGTAQNYQKARNSFAQFLKGNDIPFKNFTEEIIIKYNSFLLQRGLVRNSCSFYMRIMRAICNKAAKQKLIRHTNLFSDVYTGIDCTRKRAVPQNIISALHKLNLDKSFKLALSRDLFIFSYCTRGMSFVDMVYLKKSNLQNGYISYSRKKTGQLLIIRIEPIIEQIISKYENNDTPYVFPIITSSDSYGAFVQYQKAINTYNRHLGILSKKIMGGYRLTSYTARHSWATAARNQNVPISVISAGMGHTSEQTTRIYLDSLENSLIDEANKEIVEGLI